ncbi:MAG: DUF1573 domain-containing protein [Crocinitomicaceae bacterium]|nr:DUF1573 domain-containing protein [Crocinitomicaceae bacterium]
MMRNFSLFFLLTLLFVGCGQQDDAVIGQYTTIDVEAVYDAGTVAKGEIIKADIRIKNTGTYPLVIAEVKGACSCTVSEYEKDPIAPGKETFIKAEIDTDKTGTGMISKSVTISANTKPTTTRVVIEARVLD